MEAGKFRSFLMLLTLAGATMACSISIPGLSVRPDFIPGFESFHTGEEQEEEILVEAREDIVDLNLGFGAGRLTIIPGGEALVSGTVRYNVEELAPVLTESDNRVSLTTGDLDLHTIPTNIDGDVINEWQLTLGPSKMNLNMDLGAAAADIDLGGLALRNLTMDVGAADFSLDFSAQNTVEMDLLDLQCGAASVDLLNLANANARTISINAAAGDYNLDFSGTLSPVRDLYAELNVAAGHLRIVVPEEAAVELTIDGALMDVDTYGSWEREGNVYTRDGQAGMIQLKVNAGAGQVEVYVD
ncbi:MAG: hypothetical protein JXA25_03140 [Anaerolineales bacterium]|nr:hypothetical protein [Anaerolineales bacterium]